MSTFTERHAQWLRAGETFAGRARFVAQRTLDEHHYRGNDLLSEAMSRLSMARVELEQVAKAWIAEPFPSITCSEANALYMALCHVGSSTELGDEFMMHHAYTDEQGDDHIVVVDETGTPVGWEQRTDAHDEALKPGEPAMFTVAAELFYDSVTDSLATDITQSSDEEE